MHGDTRDRRSRAAPPASSTPPFNHRDLGPETLCHRKLLNPSRAVATLGCLELRVLPDRSLGQGVPRVAGNDVAMEMGNGVTQDLPVQFSRFEDIPHRHAEKSCVEAERLAQCPGKLKKLGMMHLQPQLATSAVVLARRKHGKGRIEFMEEDVTLWQCAMNGSTDRTLRFPIELHAAVLYKECPRQPFPYPSAARSTRTVTSGWHHSAEAGKSG